MDDNNLGRNSVVRESEFKSEDPWFDPLAGQGERQFLCPSESTLVHGLGQMLLSLVDAS